VSSDGGGSGGSGAGSGKPPRPEWPEDPLLHPASDAGWDDEPATKRPASVAPSPASSPPASAPPASAPPASSSPDRSSPDRSSPASSPIASAPIASSSPASSSPASSSLDRSSPDSSPIASSPIASSPIASSPIASSPPDTPTTIVAISDGSGSTPAPSDAAASTLAPEARDEATRPGRAWRSPSFPAYTPASGSSNVPPVLPAGAAPVGPADPPPADAAKPGSPAAEPARSDVAKQVAAPASPTSAAPPPEPTRSTRAAAEPVADEPLLPASYDVNELRSAVGASPLSDPTAATRPRKRRDPHDDDDTGDDPTGRPRNRKSIVVAGFSITAGLAIAGLVFLGRANTDRYVLVCEAERAVPQVGRAFPPWGTHSLEGEQWRPLRIAAETRCQPHETDDPLVLERAYLAMILDQASALLTAREVTKLDEAEALLKQALLLTRPAESEPAKLAGERSEHHQDIERLLGDVTYWRATAKLHDAAAALADAAKQFESAAAQHPRHVTDAAAWAGYARRLAEDLHVGPAGASPAAAVPRAPPAALPARPAAPPGIALPVEPAEHDRGSSEPAPPATSATPPDAGVPTGGVLL
jgi:hypothetical protein